MMNPVNLALVTRLPSLDLPQCHLTAGCLFQAVWNARAQQKPAAGIKDYDVFYFDEDTSWEAEDAVIKRVAALCADLAVSVEVKNQARVHLWYERRFGVPYPQLTSARDGIDRYLVECTCVGIDIGTRELYAPTGLQDLHDGILRINPKTPQPAKFLEKALSYQSRWPWLTLEPGDVGGCMPG